jgi:hypothetical protein
VHILARAVQLAFSYSVLAWLWGMALMFTALIISEFEKSFQTFIEFIIILCEISFCFNLEIIFSPVLSTED